MERPRFIRVRLVMDPPSIERFYREFAEHIAQPGAIEYRCGGLPGTGNDAAHMISDIEGFSRPLSPEWRWLPTRLSTLMRRINARHWQLPLDGATEMQLVRYHAGDDFNWHTDVNNLAGIAAKREISMSVTLRMAEAGGGVEVEGAGVAPEAPGDAVLFPSKEVHRAVPVTIGTRDSLIFRMGRA